MVLNLKACKCPGTVSEMVSFFLEYLIVQIEESVILMYTIHIKLHNQLMFYAKKEKKHANYL